jgi:hypothetical protein
MLLLPLAPGPNQLRPRPRLPCSIRQSPGKIFFVSIQLPVIVIGSARRHRLAAENAGESNLIGLGLVIVSRGTESHPAAGNLAPALAPERASPTPHLQLAKNRLSSFISRGFSSATDFHFLNLKARSFTG